MLNGRKTIGIILFDITGYYQQQLVHTLQKPLLSAATTAYFLCLLPFMAAIQKRQQVNITFSICSVGTARRPNCLP